MSGKVGKVGVRIKVIFPYLELGPQPDLDLSQRLVGLHSEDQGVGGGLAAGGRAQHPGWLWYSFIERTPFTNIPLYNNITKYISRSHLLLSYHLT